MAADAMFPEPGEQQVREFNKISENDRFFKKQYPMLYMNLNVNEHPSIVDLQYENEGTSCPLCKLNRYTLKFHEVKGYLDSYSHRFTEQQVKIQNSSEPHREG